MDIERLSVYLPMDRRHALATDHSLPDRAEGTALFADIVGFTRLTDTLVATLGPRRGAEELIRLLNGVYGALITQVHRYGGSVVGFSGDGFTCWFDQDAGPRATACGLALHQALHSFTAMPIPGGRRVAVSLKVAVASGPVRRFVVGDPQVQRLDLLAGATLDRLARAEQQSAPGEVVAGPEVAQQLGERLVVAEWRAGFAVVAGLSEEAPPVPWPELDTAILSVEALRPFLLLPVYERLMAGQGEFLAELRPAVALFQRFAGLDYDGDEQVGDKLDAYVRWVQGVLGRYGGYLLQLTSGEKGNYLYASFGALTVHEDDARRAVAAALELQRLPPELEFVQEVQIGLSRGRVRAGAYGSRTRRTYGAQGDEVNLAARLMQAAPPGEIRCSQRIYQAAEANWAFEALPLVQVKGKAGPLPVYRPVRRGAERGVRLGGTLVGRQAEMATLARLLEDTVSGRRWVLLLEGEAGIGKSRLLFELARLARERNMSWLEGAGQSIEQGTPYRAWRDLLAGYFGLGAQMEPAEQQRRVRERVTAVNPALVERLPLLNDVLRLDLPETDLTRGFDPKLRRESLTWLVVDLLRDVVLRQPLALVLEDAHWLDSLSWELALAVGRALYDRPLLLVLALRPLEEPVPTVYSALAGLEGAETLRLAAMPAEETVALAAARLGLAPEALLAEVADLVCERAAGNPFFAEELAHALRDSGALVVEEGACTLTADLSTLRQQVPDTVEGVVLSRIDRLPPEEQLTLKVAAVVGRSFLYRTLRDVHPRQVIEDLLRAHLDDLAHRDLTPLEALEPELTYLFKHVITQQVAYDTLLFAQRRELHRAVAGWYERVYAEHSSPYYPLLVYHWHRAEDVAQERHYARLAGEQAAAQYANAEAVAYLSRALALTPDDDLAGRYALLLAREKVYHTLGERETQARDLMVLEGLAKALGDDQRWVEIALRQSTYAEATGDYPAAVTAAQRAIALTPDAVKQAKGHLLWGCVLWRQGNLDTAQQQLEQALTLTRAVDLDETASPNIQKVAGDILRNLGNVLYRQSDYARARSYFEQALDTHRQVGDRWGEAGALCNLGVVCWSEGEQVGAMDCHERALAIYRQIGERRGEGLLLSNIGAISNSQGEYAKALTYLEQGLRIRSEIGDRQGQAEVLPNLALALWHLGDYDAARDWFEQCLSLSRECSDRRSESISLSNLARIAYYRGEHHLALEYGQQSLSIARAAKDRYVEGYALTYLGHALSGLGELGQAGDIYREAIALRRESGEHSLATESLAGLARATLAQGNLLQARAQVKEILAHLEREGLYRMVEPFQVYLTCYHVLQANEDAKAQEVLASAYGLLQEQASKLPDEPARRLFLENVAPHREIVSAYQAGQEGP
jgi:class 3 adenylate cyclase/tetratricopeptide (TPR) repeat protein